MDKAGHNVTMIEKNPDHLKRLGQIHHIHSIIGSGLDQDTLLQAGIEGTDAFVAATQGDNTNLMAAQMVQDLWNVQKICAKVNDAIRADTYRKLGVFTVTPNALTAGLLHTWLLDEEFKNINEYNRLYEELLQ
jgi:trk system potassium uptake protein TrkA